MNKPITHTLEYYLAHTKKEPLEHVTIWITLKNMLLTRKDAANSWKIVGMAKLTYSGRRVVA